MGWEHVAALSLCVGIVNQLVPVLMALIENQQSDSSTKHQQ
ncbi:MULTISPECIES: hypothetical protein [Shewanella]|nr:MULTISPECIES: hypothetical protein [Shewanella]KPZ71927.1 hypothetical protein AN944_01175 [Shewanella sp. P1-14-1]